MNLAAAPSARLGFIPVNPSRLRHASPGVKEKKKKKRGMEGREQEREEWRGERQMVRGMKEDKRRKQSGRIMRGNAWGGR